MSADKKAPNAQAAFPTIFEPKMHRKKKLECKEAVVEGECSKYSNNSLHQPPLLTDCYSRFYFFKPTVNIS